MVLAVPLTAVIRIRLAATPHPLPQHVAQMLAGGTDNRPPRLTDLHTTFPAEVAVELPDQHEMRAPAEAGR